MANVLDVNDANWKAEVEESAVPVLVDFWAPWCGPCRQLGPTVEAIATEYAGKLKVVKVNTDEAGALAGRFGVMSIPVLMLFKGGRIVEQLLGNQPKARITARLDPHLEG